MRRPQIQYFKDSAGEWRWHVRSANGEVVAEGEGHRDRTDAERAAGEALVTFEAARSEDVDSDEQD